MAENRHCPPDKTGEPASDCLWRVRGYSIKKMEWESYLVRASDEVGAMAQAEFRWGKSHKYLMISGDPILATSSSFPPILDDGAPDKGNPNKDD